MLISRQDFAELMQVSNKYLYPSNFNHLKNGAKEKGYLLLSIQGRGKTAQYEIEPLYPDLPNEIWKECPIAPEYQISSCGRVKHPKGGILTGTNNRGYIRTRIADLGQLPNHRLVMLTFCPIENPELYVVDHINGIKSDNNLNNLRWVLQSKNIEFADQNYTELNEILGKLVQKYGYLELKEQLLALL